MSRPIPFTALNLIQEFEGCKLVPYRDGAGILTVGYGHKLHGGLFGKIRAPISMDEAATWAIQDAEAAGVAVERLITAPLTDNQFAALVDFTFNLGAGALGGSSLRHDLNCNQYYLAAEEFPRWVHDHLGIVEPGLLRRRIAEQTLWRS